MATVANGFSVSRYPSRIGIKSFKVPGSNGVYLPVRSEIAPLLIGFAREFDQKVERLVRGWNWGFHYRQITGGSGYSWHSAGIAIDLNAPRHAYGRRNTFNAAQRATIRALCRKYGLRWGGDYRGTKDEMHFEVIVGRAAALALVRRLQSQPAPRPAPVRPVPMPAAGTAKLRIDGGFGPATIKRLQGSLRKTGAGGLPVDGKFGPATKHALQGRLNHTERAKGRAGVKIDGDFGPQSVKALQRNVGARVDGDWGRNTTIRLQMTLNAREL